MRDSNIQKIKVFDIFREWIETMTMHGFPNIFRTKYLTVRIIWIISFLASNGFCFYIITINTINFFKYEVVTTIKVAEKNSIPFPAVTVCNANPFLTEDGLKFVENFLMENNLTDSILDFHKENSTFLYLTYVRYFSVIFSKGKTKDFLKNLSISFEQMFISCLYNFQPCGNNDWIWFYDMDFGNCFRFNTGKDSNEKQIEIKNSTESGKYFGLLVELFVGTPKSENTLSISTGAHIYIDDNFYRPKFGQGFDIALGERTNLAMERIKNEQMSKPYSECLDNLDSIDSFDSEYYKQVIKSNLTYRQSDCIQAYFDSEIYKKCNCVLATNNFDIENINYCDSFEYYNCALEYSRQVVTEIDLSNYKSKFAAICPLECDSVSFRISKSENRYPSESYGNILSKNDKIKGLFGNKSNISNDELRNNVLSVNIFYENLKQTEISQSPRLGLITTTCVLRWGNIINISSLEEIKDIQNLNLVLNGIPISLIVYGLVVFLVGVFGFFSVWTSNRLLLIIHEIIVIIIFLIHIGAIIAILVAWPTIESQFQKELNKTLEDVNNKVDIFNLSELLSLEKQCNSLLEVSKQYDCCGIMSPDDFNFLIRLKCCKVPTPKQGCLDLLVKKTKEYSIAGYRHNYETKYKLNLSIGNQAVPLDPFQTFLGIKFDPKLNFKKLVESLSEKVMSKINLIRRNFIRSQFDNAFIPLSSSTQITDDLQKMQNRILRHIKFFPLKTRITNIHNNLKIDMVATRTKLLLDKFLLKRVEHQQLTKDLECYSTNTSKFRSLYEEFKNVLSQKSNS
ncbi:acid-sensing ion channel 2 [Brachionus plicatilis]|uniref:Acid-sensing ion channel 2 n=1 Tax=Brachionus plicatilis TaxID=10195 RepID=A0A3M7SJD8_BRAPC|nr:acid-sensing ion channel 2 [Brachionus plicatilis]